MFINKYFYSIATALAAFMLIIGTYVWYKKAPSLPLANLANKKNIVPIAIIGSGPAGLAAALYAARAKIYTVVFEGKQPGGQLTTTSTVENWPGINRGLGPDIIKGLRKQAEEYGALCIPETIVKVDFSQWPFVLTQEDGVEINAATVILATGATPQKLNIPGEQQYWGKGVTTCAVCDAPFFKESNVVIVGGGDSAIEEALQLAPYVKHATLLVRSSALRASATMQEHLREYNHIDIQFNTQITAIKGDDNFVTSIDILHDGKPSTMTVDGVFLAIGHRPSTELFKKYITLDKQGYITLSCRAQTTSIPGIFAAGDIADNKYRQAGVASGDGIKAALDALEFLRNNGYNDKFEQEHQASFYKPQYAHHKKLVKISSKDQFTAEVINSPVPVILDFYTDYCPSCLQMMPVVEIVAESLGDTIKFVKVNALEFQELAEELAVPTVPTLLVMDKGKIVGRTKDIMNKQQLTAFARKFISTSNAA